MREYAKVFEGGKEVWKLLNGFGGPVREVGTMEWGIDDYINYCLYPLQNCINRMQGVGEPDSEIQEFVDILDRLYDSAHAQLMKMEEAINKDLGGVQIFTTSEDCLGGFFEQAFLEVHVEKEPDKEAVNA